MSALDPVKGYQGIDGSLGLTSDATPEQKTLAARAVRRWCATSNLDPADLLACLDLTDADPVTDDG